MFPKSISRFFPTLFLLVLILAPASAARATPSILHVAPDGVNSGNCDSWANACTLQHALAVAFSGDEIWVKAGVYYPGTNRADTFTLENGVAIYGGFEGTENSRNQRNWQANITILSGDIDQNDTNTDGNNIAETWNDIWGNNAYHVVVGDGTDNTAVLDGFVITAGLATGQWPRERGGGVFNSGGSPKITNVTFSGNYAANYGGGMSNMTSSPTLTNVTFSGNSATYHGGGMYNDSSSSPTLTNVTFSGNSTAHYGGGMSNFQSSPTLTNVIFSGNSAPSGGGMDDQGGSSPTLTNVTFSGNSANDGGGMWNYYSNPTLTNVIMWGNTATNDGQGIYNTSSNPTISYSDVQNCKGLLWNPACGNDGGHNKNTDPLFVDADGADNTPGTADDNLRLQLTSPAIDAGKNAAVPPGVTTDLDGNPRFVDIPSVPNTGSGTPPIVDMGAYETLNKLYLPLILRLTP